MNREQELRDMIRRIDHKGYPNYKQLKGGYQFPTYELRIHHVQGDPFHAPSSVSVKVAGAKAGFPADLYDTEEKRFALQDELLRTFARVLKPYSFQAKGSGKSGLMSVSQPGQEILARTGCEIDSQRGDVILRMEIGFPANGRTINGRELEKILFTFLPQCVQKSLFYKSLDAVRLQKTACLAEDQTFLRQQLQERGLVAFVANGAVLPRESGVSNRPMKDAVVFQSPKTMEVEMALPNGGSIRGMGIPKGVTLIVGGGYHGKSTLLKALELGVYNHIAGDGREYVVTDATAMKIRAEDGRGVKKTDISLFITNLPNGRDTKQFVTEDASGSTSQAANMAEAMEAGCQTFLIDEDTSATNFMIRDELMQRVVSSDVEPITPFTMRVRELYEKEGISTILVAGSSGSYFHKADVVLQMNRYMPQDITDKAKEAAKEFPLPLEDAAPYQSPNDRRIYARDSKFAAEQRIKSKVMGRDGIMINRDTIDLRYVEQLCDTEQLAGLVPLMKFLRARVLDGKKDLIQCVDEVAALYDKQGWQGICGGSYVPSGISMPRKQEIFACINRWRSLRI